MLSLRVLDPVTLATRGYLALGKHHEPPTVVESCDTASHFLSTTSAALVRERYKGEFTDQLTVTPCLCPVGQAYRAQIRHP